MIVNDRLDTCDPTRLNALDRFKNRIVERFCRADGFLLDIGSASGRFLHQQRGNFRRVAGVEVTPESVEFARGLGLEITGDLESLDGTPSVVTFWHSLEHIPADAVVRMLSWLGRHREPDTVVIISVPNAASLQARLFRERFAFYDVPHHLHQFTPGSLDRLMADAGFAQEKLFRSFLYENFGWLQGMLNLFNRQHDYFYYRRKRGYDFGLSPSVQHFLDIFNLLIIPLLLPFSLLMTLFGAAMPRQGGVLTVCYRPRTHST